MFRSLTVAIKESLFDSGGMLNDLFRQASAFPYDRELSLNIQGVPWRFPITSRQLAHKE